MTLSKARVIMRCRSCGALEARMTFDPDEVQTALRESWSLATARQWTPENPAAGQCNVTAILVHDLFGGELLKTPLPAGDHFYNRIGGRRYDFTEDQFGQRITYMDLPTSRAEAERGSTSTQLEALAAAFQLQTVRSD